MAVFSFSSPLTHSYANASEFWKGSSSLPSSIATKRLILDVVKAGKRLVAVGAFGHVVFSDDRGKSWTQAKTPTRNTLTSVHFPSANIGYAVGLDNIIIKTIDGGANWRKIHIDPDLLLAKNRFEAFSGEPNDCGGKTEDDDCLIPLLSVFFLDNNNGFAVGAFGQALFTKNGGQDWEWRPLPKARVKNEFEDPKDPTDDYEFFQAHLNGIARTTNGNIYIAAEYGVIYRSTDGGNNFTPISTGYNGSFWGILPLGNSILAYGMRGNIWRSDDNGNRWRKLDTGNAHQSFQDGIRLEQGFTNGYIVLAGLNGVIAISRDGGRSFRAYIRAERQPYAALIEGDSGQILLFGDRGITTTKAELPTQ